MRFLNLITLSMALVFALASCDRDSGPTMSSDPTAPSISAPDADEAYQLSEDQAEEVLLTMEWSRADFGYDAAVEYEVQISESGDNFEEHRTLGSTTQDYFDILVGELNSVLLTMGFIPNEEAHVQLRVVAIVDGSNVQEVSEPISVIFTPYLVEVEIPEVYVPGNYQEASGYTANWSPADAPPLFSPDDDEVYEGYVYMAEGGNMFKFTPERNWDDDWGVAEQEGELIGGGEGDDIELDDPGYYRFIVDTDELVYEYENTEWGIIGEAVGGWDEGDDVMMEYDMEDHVWIHEDVDLDAGEMKFRANEAWDLNYGDDGGNFELDQDGDNIQVEEAGNYTVILNLGEYPFSYELIMN